MCELNRLVVFRLDGQRYGLRLSNVERLVHAVEITPVPNAPPVLLGIINVRGRVIPVVSLRRIFGLPEREIALSDLVILASLSNRDVALVADDVVGLVEVSGQEVIDAESITADADCVSRVVKHEQGMILVCDLDRLLSGMRWTVASVCHA